MSRKVYAVMQVICLFIHLQSCSGQFMILQIEYSGIITIFYVTQKQISSGLIECKLHPQASFKFLYMLTLLNIYYMYTYLFLHLDFIYVGHWPVGAGGLGH